MADGHKLSSASAEYLKNAVLASKQWSLPDGRGSAADCKPTAIKKAAVIGGGTMGRGIAIACVRAGYETTLVENDQKALDVCLRELEKTYARELTLKRLSPDELGVLRSPKFGKTTDLSAVADADLVIEAIFESMKLKKALLLRLDQIVKPSTTIASNTSSLDFDEMSAVLGNPSRLVGMHFFNPPHLIKVVEIVYGSETSKEAVSRAFLATNDMKKIPILVANCPSFMFNRLLGVYLHQAMKLVSQHGMYPRDIDRIVQSFGFQMGPMTMHDMNGIDVGAKVKSEHGLPLSAIEQELLKRKWYGRKTGRGYYNYDQKGVKSDDAEVKVIIDDIARGQSKQQQFFSDSDVISFLLYPMVNEGFLCLEEGIIDKPQLIDLMFFYGFGWPARHCGPMRWAVEVEGLPRIREAMRSWSAREPTEFFYRLSDEFERASKL